MPASYPPLARTITATLARVILNEMRHLEETHIDADARWEFLRRQMERIAKGDEQ